MSIFGNVTRALVVGVTLIGASGAGAQRAATHPTVDGVWAMDTTKFVKRDRELAGLVLHVSHRGDTLLVVTNVQDAGRAPLTMTARYLPQTLLGPRAAGDTTRISAEAWAGDTLVLRATEARPDRTLEIEERWSIDASGRTLSRFQHVIDGKRVSQQTLVFTRT
jgi:hypothetical protein